MHAKCAHTERVFVRCTSRAAINHSLSSENVDYFPSMKRREKSEIQKRRIFLSLPKILILSPGHTLEFYIYRPGVCRTFAYRKIQPSAQCLSAFECSCADNVGKTNDSALIVILVNAAPALIECRIIESIIRSRYGRRAFEINARFCSVSLTFGHLV